MINQKLIYRLLYIILISCFQSSFETFAVQCNISDDSKDIFPKDSPNILSKFCCMDFGQTMYMTNNETSFLRQWKCVPGLSRWYFHFNFCDYIP